MGHPAGEWNDGTIRVDFNRRLKLEFHGSRITSDAGLLAYRELDDALRLTDLAGAALAECRRGKNTRHLLTGLFRQSVFGRLAGYEDVNDADRLAHDPAMRAVVDRNGLDQRAASTSQMGRFETAWLTSEANLAALMYQCGTAEQWIKEGKNAVAWTRLSCHRFAANAVRLQLHALAYNMANFLRTLALPDEVKQWSLTTLREKLVKIGAKIVRHGRSVTFQMAEVMVPRELFQQILAAIATLRPSPPARC